LSEFRYRSVTEVAGLAGLCLFAAAGLQHSQAASLAGAILLGVLLLRRPRIVWPSWHNPLVLLSLTLSLYVLCRGLLRYAEAPEQAELIGRWTGYYFLAAGLPAIVLALSLEASRARILLVLNIALAALVVAILRDMDEGQLAAYRQGARAFFGLGNAAGLYISSALLGVLLLVPWGAPGSATSAAWPHRLRQALFLAVLALLAVALVWHQNRSVLLAVLVVFPVLAWLSLRRRGADPAARFPRWVLIALGLSLAVMLFVGGGDIKQRFEQGFVSARLALTVDAATLPRSAAGERISLWRIGWRSAGEYPLFGRGPGSVSELVREHPVVARHSHLHNLYLQLLVELGLVGLLLFLALVGCLMRELLWHRSALSWDLRRFTGGSLALFLLTNLTQVRIDGNHAHFFVTLLMALAMTGALAFKQDARGRV